MSRLSLLTSWVLLVCAGCVTVAPRLPLAVAPKLPPAGPPVTDALPPEPQPTERGRELLARREELVTAARRYVGLRSLRKVTRRVPDDCSGFVRLVYRRVGHEPQLSFARRGENATTALWREAEAAGLTHREQPAPGDLVFFRETYDRNRDGKRNDGLTHVGLVEAVAHGGVVTFIHRGSKGVVRARLDPARPRLRHDERGEVVNDFIRAPDRTRGPRLTGALFAGYARAEVWLAPSTSSVASTEPR